jgi:hypothetical protein
VAFLNRAERAEVSLEYSAEQFGPLNLQLGPDFVRECAELVTWGRPVQARSSGSRSISSPSCQLPSRRRS